MQRRFHRIGENLTKKFKFHLICRGGKSHVSPLPFAMKKVEGKLQSNKKSFPSAVNTSSCIWKPTSAFVSLLGCQQDNFNLKLHSARDPGDKYWCVKSWCCARFPGPSEVQWYQKRSFLWQANSAIPKLAFSRRCSSTFFWANAAVPAQEAALPCLQSCIVLKDWIGYPWAHGVEKCRNAILCMHSHWSSDEIYGNRSGQNFVIFKSLNIYSEIGSCLCGIYPNSKNPINAYLNDRFTWFALELLHILQVVFFTICNVLQREGISTSDWVHPSRSSHCLRLGQTQALLGSLTI